MPYVFRWVYCSFSLSVMILFSYGVSIIAISRIILYNINGEHGGSKFYYKVNENHL